MQAVFIFIKKHRVVVIGLIFILTITGVLEFYFGRSLLGPDGKFGWWDNNVWGSENSQRVADAYSFSHIIHGILFYAFLWLVVRKVPLKYRFIMALVLEAGWELLENSSFVINRYREATIAQGYVGDSVLNSVMDVAMAGIGFVLAKYSKVWVTISLIILMELGCLFWIRDNLTLNIIMLVRPVESIKVWQSEWH